MLDPATINSLFPADLPEPAHWEQRYPRRELPEGAKVTRVGPSPTGFLHIGGLYVAMIDKDISTRTGGRYLLRIEDTDQAREVEGAVEQFDRAFERFGLRPDEHGDVGEYGPYRQSERSEIYLTYARELMRRGLAYPCFATKDELTAITAAQQGAKLPTGYYGKWALWRDADPEDVRAKLADGTPYVVRFRSPGGDAEATARVGFVDAIRGPLEADDNRNDVVLLKTSDAPNRLPTYHFAHAVDDHLMRVNLIIRGEEWISSVPLHLQLFDALGFEQIEYAHIAPLMKQVSGSKRKLSKRKDPEATVDFYLESGFPVDAVTYYMRGLVNGRLAEVPLAEALDAPIQLSDCGTAGPLVDMVKLEDICADHIATMSGEQILAAVTSWAREYDPDLVPVLESRTELAIRALAVEREGVDNPRKDLRKWSDFRSTYGFFFPELFDLVDDPADERLAALGVAPNVVRELAADLADNYQERPDQPTWFEQIRELAARHGFAPTAKEYKKNPDAYPGALREASQVIRVALTGATRSPDLFAVTQAIGTDEVLRRLRALAGPS